MIGSAAFVRVVSSDTGATTWYLWNGATIPAIPVPSGSSIDATFWGDTYVVVRDADSLPTLRKVNDDGSLGVTVPNPATAVSTIKGLAVAPGRIVGADNRTPLNLTFPAWSRTVSGTTLGAETALPKRASGLAASARRTAVSGKDGLTLLDGSTVKYTFSDAHLGQLSGPYVTQPTFDASFNPYVQVSKTDGTAVATFPTWTGVLFGSRYLSFTSDANPAGATTVRINDLTGGPTRDKVLASASANCAGWTAWNDLVAATCDTGHAVRVDSLTAGQVVASMRHDRDTAQRQGGSATGTRCSTGRSATSSGTSRPPHHSSSSTVSANGVRRRRPHRLRLELGADLARLLLALDVAGPGPRLERAADLLHQCDVLDAGDRREQAVQRGDADDQAREHGRSTCCLFRHRPTAGAATSRGTGRTTPDTAVSGTFTVTLNVTGADGSGPVGAVDGSIEPKFTVMRTTPGAFVALAPSRLLDTRDGTGVAAPGAIVANGATDPAGHRPRRSAGDRCGRCDPNVAAVTPAASGFLTAYPTGGTVPVASNLNFTAGQVVPNLVVAKVGTGGKVTIRNSSTGSTQVIADVAGYFADGDVTDAGGLTAITPARLLDTRTTAVVKAGEAVKVQASGGVLPAAGLASAVVVNITAVTPTSSGFLTAYPSGTTMPTASNVNFTAGQVVPNLAFVKLAADGSFTVRNSSTGTTHIVVDVAAYVTAGTPTLSGMFVPVSPTRFSTPALPTAGLERSPRTRPRC